MIVARNAGAVYFAGRTSGALPGFINLGGDDYFLAAYSLNGQVQGTVQNGSPQSRTVFCQRSDGASVASSFCSGAGTQPANSQSCTGTGTCSNLTFTTCGAT